METTKRVPQGLGNLAQNARFPHSHSQLSIDETENTKPRTEERDRSTRCLDRHAVMAGFAVSVNGRFSDVHRGTEFLRMTAARNDTSCHGPTPVASKNPQFA